MKSVNLASSLSATKILQESSFREEPLLFSVAWFALCWIGSHEKSVAQKWLRIWIQIFLKSLKKQTF